MWKFEYTETADINKDKVWEHYSDVSLWPVWDDSAKSVVINGAFETGATGVTTDTDNAKTPFVLRDVVSGKGYTMVTGFQELGIEIHFIYTIIPVDVGRYKLSHCIEIHGANAEAIGEQLGFELTKNFAEGMNDLITACGGEIVR